MIKLFFFMIIALPLGLAHGFTQNIGKTPITPHQKQDTVTQSSSTIEEREMGIIPSNTVYIEKELLQKPFGNPKTLVSKQELLQMAPEKQKIFLDNPDMYLIVEGNAADYKQPKTITALEWLYLEPAVQERILTRPDEFQISSVPLSQEKLSLLPKHLQLIVSKHPNLFLNPQ